MKGEKIMEKRILVPRKMRKALRSYISRLMIVSLALLVLAPGTSAWGFRGNRHFSSGHHRGGTRSHSIVNRRFRQNLSRHQFHRREFRSNRFHRRGHFGHRNLGQRRYYESLYFGYYHDDGGFYFSNRVWVPGQWVETQDGYWIWEPGDWMVISPR